MNRGGATMVISSKKSTNKIKYPSTHTGAILAISFDTNTFTYTNPWNSNLFIIGNLDYLIDDIKNDRIDIFIP
jgi:hypothetical protein